MGSLSDFSAYAKEYMAAAGQLATYRYAREWMEAGVSAAHAAAWASAGYLPAEAAPLIAQGVTPQMAADLEGISMTMAGSPEEHAMQVIDRLVADGILVDPKTVRRQRDG